jgi:UDP-N-acetylmuramoyl-tripeptide--D-alanyl-D-alanine ligase
MMNLSDAAVAIGATHVGRDVMFMSVGTDSRAVTPGMLFVALKGDRFDGHDYVRDVIAAGAAAAMVSRQWAAANPDMPLIAVDDTRLALGAMAAHWRAQFAIPLIGITGSNGKTTVKEMCAAILGHHCGNDAVLATQGNFNNDIGLPLTLLRLRDAHRAAVIEMGMNHPGEIAYLTRLARPTVALVNNAQRAHLEGLGSVTEVARAKGEIFDGLGPDGVAVINADDPHATMWRGMNGKRTVIDFGFAGAAAVRGEWCPQGFGGVLKLNTPSGTADVALDVPGEHNARNALAATAVCLAAGVALADIAVGLGGYGGVKGRLQRGRGISGATVIDDSYNANPDSMRAAIDVLAGVTGKRILVMGDMGEVGEAAAQFHDEIGGHAKSCGIEMLLALGSLSADAVHNFGEGARHFDNVETLIAALKPELDANTTVLVKGSRFMRMERVVNAIKEK